MGSEMCIRDRKKGYPGAFSAAVTSSSASLAIIIPPSIPMILYAVMAQSSVVQLFVAGIIPGILGGFLMIRRPPRSTPKPSSAASDVYKRQQLY